MKKIILTEKQEEILINHILNENAEDWSKKENVILQWLNKYFKPMDLYDDDEYGLPKRKLGASILTQDGEVSDKIISSDDLFYKLQHRFKTILSDKDERDLLIKSALKKWF